MKRAIILLIVVSLLCSCTTINTGRSTSSIYNKIPDGSPIYLREIELHPAYMMSGIAEELPELLRCCLKNNGFAISDNPGPGIYNLDVFLHRKSWQFNYKTYESITFRLLLSQEGKPAAYRLYTEDTDMSINSFSWTLSMINENITKLAASVNNEK